ncbi:hypothetical protein SSX86_031996 [Deinandra increscens subsp. villosa]|uniref:Reverse transcriptase n=1 Tax=Deinandra increscens subsp. villosa TaxID=3103831 RepID=A0AAP0C7X9_9ASTR
MHNYHRNVGEPKCALKVDIQKAYDTVDWGFLNHILCCFGLPDLMVNWIMTFISTVSYSICLNGELHGYFRGKRGSATCLMRSMDDFSKMSGLVPSLPKSTIFFCNVGNDTKAAILNRLPFKEGNLPVKYLGVPLLSSGLRYRDCHPLLEAVDNHISSWRNKSLSFVGRLQLILSVLSSMHIYRASVFLLPARVVNELEAKMRGFLWSQGKRVKGAAKVSWNVVCRPKGEGGLGIRCITDMNRALLAKHVWSILTRRSSLWVDWIYTYRLKNRTSGIAKLMSLVVGARGTS